MERTTEYVARFVSELKYEDIPSEVIERAKRRAMLQVERGVLNRTEYPIKPFYLMASNSTSLPLFPGGVI